MFFLFGINATLMPIKPLLAFLLPVLIWQQIISLWLQRYNINPREERGLLLKGKLLSLAAWPVYFMAFLSVFAGKRLGYEVTPKGNAQIHKIDLNLFFPHALFGLSLIHI